jgi:hypothetical protein
MIIGTKEALEIAAKQFRDYEAHHQKQADGIDPGVGYNFSAVAKSCEEKAAREAKALRNRQMAEMCEQAAAEVISPPSPNQVTRDGQLVTMWFANEILAAEAHEEVMKVFQRRASAPEEQK